MTSYTPNLKLLKKDPSTDGNDTFNISTMLNDNWDNEMTLATLESQQLKKFAGGA